MRNILSVSWLGQGDFGDEAMAFALRSALRARDLPTPVSYQAGKSGRYVGPDEDPVTALHPFGRSRRVIKLLDYVKLRRFDTVLIGGGSLFHSEASVAWKHDLVRRVRSRYGSRSTVACVGVSVGPFTSESARQRFHEFARDVDCFVLRDDHSAETMREAGTEAGIFPATDLSALLPGMLEAEFPAAGPDDTVDAPIGLALVQPGNADAGDLQRRFSYFSDLLNELLDTGRRVVLFTLHVGSDFQDASLNESLAVRSNHPDRVDQHQFNGDVLRTARAISQCAGMLSMRLHGAIFAYLSRVPFVSLGYNAKNRWFGETVQYPDEYMFELDQVPDSTPLTEALQKAMHSGPGLFADSVPVADGAARISAGIDHVASLIHERHGQSHT